MEPGTRGARILAVDDEPAILEILSAILAAAGYEVETAPDGQTALRRLDAQRFDAVLSDIHMPGLDGIGLYQALVERQPHLARRFVFITGSALTPEARTFVAETGIRVLEKPFNLREVQGLVRQILET